jgi:hypothetical protein
MMKKEVLQIRRDPRSLLIILLMPVLAAFHLRLRFESWTFITSRCAFTTKTARNSVRTSLRNFRPPIISTLSMWPQVTGTSSSRSTPARPWPRW